MGPFVQDRARIQSRVSSKDNTFHLIASPCLAPRLWQATHLKELRILKKCLTESSHKKCYSDLNLHTSSDPGKSQSSAPFPSPYCDCLCFMCVLKSDMNHRVPHCCSSTCAKPQMLTGCGWSQMFANARSVAKDCHIVCKRKKLSTVCSTTTRPEEAAPWVKFAKLEDLSDGSLKIDTGRIAETSTKHYISV